MEDSNAKTAWLSITIGVILGAGIATASAYLLHMRILEQVKTRLGLEELSRRRRTRRAKRIAQLCKRQDQQQQQKQQDEEEEEAEEEHHRLQHAVAAAGTQSQADLVTAAADNSRDSPRSSTNISNVTSSNAVNAMPILLPRVQIHCHGIAYYAPRVALILLNPQCLQMLCRNYFLLFLLYLPVYLFIYITSISVFKKKSLKRKQQKLPLQQNALKVRT